MTHKFLVLGGTGKTGRKVVQRLESMNMDVRIGSRNANPAFDWTNPTTWQDVLEGVDKVYVTYHPDLAVPGALETIKNLIHLAIEKGVKQMVLLSGKGEKEAQACEKLLVNSGIEYTVVRASWFNQNFSESFFLDPIKAGYVALPKAEAKVPYVDTDDIADVVVKALTESGHSGQIYEMTGPRTLTFSEVVQEIATATNREIQFSSISLPDYVHMLEEMKVPADYVWMINYLFSEVLDADGNDVVSNDIEKVLGRKARDFSQYALETAQSGVWN